MNDDTVTTLAQAAKYLGISHPAMVKRIGEGGDAAPRYTRQGTRYVFARTDLDAFIAEHGHGPALDRRRYVKRDRQGRPIKD